MPSRSAGRMGRRPWSRAGLTTRAAVLAIAVSLCAACDPPAGPARPAAFTLPPGPEAASVSAAYTFLDELMDQRATGSVLRLPSSYRGGVLGAQGFTTSFTYDDALVVIALVRRGTAADLARATVLGDALLYVQAHATPADGRIGAGYGPGPLTSAGAATPTVAAVNVGNMSWVGIALLQLFHRTGQLRYRAGAAGIAGWIQRNALDPRGVAGYNGGRDAAGVALTYKSTENNLDVQAFFAMLTAAGGPKVWASRAATAAAFVRSMWNTLGYFAVGTGLDGVTPSTGVIAEDTQTWPYLVRSGGMASTALDWARTHLAAVDPPYRGVSSSDADRSKVWFEGTAHLAAALYRRDHLGDVANANALVATIRLAQVTAPNHDGRGIVAASADGLRSGFGDLYYASLHTGTTAWYVLAAQRADPFQLF